MLPTATLPLSPLTGSAGFGLLVAALAVGAFVALVVGYLLYRHDEPTSPRVDVSAAEAASQSRSSTRLSA
jgi:hypothetical protein